ncbi:VanZ family protein [Microbacterium sp. cf332]|uniref:VanZ family protein n=1 Tax=Microbacterium sp. cf332 TaxID=1761804 RepID=UPI00087FAAF8|nr:VanZ family protein [Microbacterium sp. cf332]SDQ43962.1 Glycopeptide antibiotics resistance protein [Microbacterium sp. cf332]
MTATRRTISSAAIARLLLAAYIVVLAFIAFWPTPVDRDAGPLLRSITAAVPWLTYGRIEFAANIVLFVPFGWCAAIGWRRWHAVVIPAALAISVVIELAQGALLVERTSSVLDVVANTAGATVGWLIARPWRRVAPRRRDWQIVSVRQPASGD